MKPSVEVTQLKSTVVKKVKMYMLISCKVLKWKLVSTVHQRYLTFVNCKFHLHEVLDPYRKFQRLSTGGGGGGWYPRGGEKQYHTVLMSRGRFLLHDWVDMGVFMALKKFFFALWFIHSIFSWWVRVLEGVFFVQFSPVLKSYKSYDKILKISPLNPRLKTLPKISPPSPVGQDFLCTLLLENVQSDVGLVMGFTLRLQTGFTTVCA